MGMWCMWGMALALVVNGVATFTGPIELWMISRALIAVCGMGVLPAVLDQMPSRAVGWARWVTCIAYLGLGAEALRRVGGLEFRTAELLFGGLGVWGLAVNLIALRQNLWPRVLAWIGLASSVMLFGVVLASRVAALAFLDTISAGIGAVVLYPIWLVWMGMRLRTKA